MFTAKCWLRCITRIAAGIRTKKPDWRLQIALMKFLESNWDKPDDGIWEVRGGRRNFTHSKMMAWMAFDRADQAGGAIQVSR